MKHQVAIRALNRGLQPTRTFLFRAFPSSIVGAITIVAALVRSISLTAVAVRAASLVSACAWLSSTLKVA